MKFFLYCNIDILMDHTLFHVFVSTQAALANALGTGDKSKRSLGCDVISYSTASSQSARSVENLLRCLIQWLRKMKDTEEESPLPQTYQWVVLENYSEYWRFIRTWGCILAYYFLFFFLRDLLSEFHSKLSEIKKDRPLALLVDGVDLVQDSRRQISSDWIPQQLPQVGDLGISRLSFPQSDHTKKLFYSYYEAWIETLLILS